MTRNIKLIVAESVLVVEMLICVVEKRFVLSSHSSILAAIVLSACWAASL